MILEYQKQTFHWAGHIAQRTGTAVQMSRDIKETGKHQREIRNDDWKKKLSNISDQYEEVFGQD